MGMGLRCGILSLALLAGCYEGWENPNGNGNGPGNPNPTPTDPTPSPAPYFYILLHFIVPTSDAIADADCLPNQGIADYRANEWSLRRAAIVQAVLPLAERFQQIETPIGADDCQSLAAVSVASLEEEPWLPEDAPADDPLDRLLVHLKVVLWDEDASATPPSIVTATDWIAWDDLRADGRRTFSGHHFIVTSDFDGYFGTWAASLPEANTLVSAGLPASEIDPSPGGLETRNLVIASQTQELGEWLLQIDLADDIETDLEDDDSDQGGDGG